MVSLWLPFDAPTTRNLDLTLPSLRSDYYHFWRFRPVSQKCTDVLSYILLELLKILSQLIIYHYLHMAY